MHDLQLVGFTTDRRGLIFRTTAGARAESYVVHITDELVSLLGRLADVDDDAATAADEAAPPVVGAAARSSAPRAESQLSVREIQARLRAGEDVARVAREAGVDDDWIERFAPPVRAEQRRIIDRALAAHLERPRAGASAVPLRRAVGMAMADKGIAFTVAAFDAAWSSRLIGHDRWAVQFTYRHRGKERTAVWDFDAADGTITTADRTASQLGFVGPDDQHDADAGAVIDGIIGDPDATPIGTAPLARAGAGRRPRATDRAGDGAETSASGDGPPAQSATEKASTGQERATATRAAGSTKPASKSRSHPKKAAPATSKAQKAAAKKAAAKKAATSKKAATKKPTAKKPATKKASVEKAATKKASVEKAAAKKAATSTKPRGSATVAPPAASPAPNGPPSTNGSRPPAPAPPSRGPAATPSPAVPPTPRPEAESTPDDRRRTVQVETRRGGARTVGAATDDGEVANPEELLRVRARRVEERLSQQGHTAPGNGVRPAAADGRTDRRTAPGSTPGTPDATPVEQGRAERPPVSRPWNVDPEPEDDRAAARRARAAERNAHTVQFRSGAAAPVRVAGESGDGRPAEPAPPRPAPGEGQTPPPGPAPTPPVDANGAARPRTRRRRQLRAR